MSGRIAQFKELTQEEKAARRARKAAQPATKRTDARLRDGSKTRRIVVTVYPAGMIGLRLEHCRQEELLDVAAAFHRAIKERKAAERVAKKKARKS